MDGTLKISQKYYFGDKIDEICAPLFNNFPISYFNYAIAHIENNEITSFVSATNSKNWYPYYCQSNYKFISNGKKMHSWASIMDPKAQQEAEIRFGLYNGIYIEKVYI